MGKFIAKPVEVDAYKVIGIVRDPQYITFHLDGRSNLKIPPHDGMLARIEPKIGDYFVVQSDGYECFNPGAVFERKYGPKEAA